MFRNHKTKVGAASSPAARRTPNRYLVGAHPVTSGSIRLPQGGTSVTSGGAHLLPFRRDSRSCRLPLAETPVLVARHRAHANGRVRPDRKPASAHERALSARHNGCSCALAKLCAAQTIERSRIVISGRFVTGGCAHCRRPRSRAPVPAARGHPEPARGGQTTARDPGGDTGCAGAGYSEPTGHTARGTRRASHGAGQHRPTGNTGASYPVDSRTTSSG